MNRSQSVTPNESLPTDHPLIKHPLTAHPRITHSLVTHPLTTHSLITHPPITHPQDLVTDDGYPLGLWVAKCRLTHRQVNQSLLISLPLTHFPQMSHPMLPMYDQYHRLLRLAARAG